MGSRIKIEGKCANPYLYVSGHALIFLIIILMYEIHSLKLHLADVLKQALFYSQPSTQAKEKRDHLILIILNNESFIERLDEIKDPTTELETALLGNQDDEFATLGVLASNDDGPSLRIDFAGGFLKYYFSDHRFEATCQNKAHRTKDGTLCRLTRTSQAGVNLLYPDGRPIGTLGHWLEDCDKATREEHRDAFYIASMSLHRRKLTREDIKNTPGGLAICEQERKQRPGEPEEPEVVPMGW